MPLASQFCIVGPSAIRIDLPFLTQLCLQHRALQPCQRILNLLTRTQLDSAALYAEMKRLPAHLRADLGLVAQESATQHALRAILPASHLFLSCPELAREICIHVRPTVSALHASTVLYVGPHPRFDHKYCAPINLSPAKATALATEALSKNTFALCLALTATQCMAVKVLHQYDDSALEAIGFGFNRRIVLLAAHENEKRD